MKFPIKHFTGGEVDPQAESRVRHGCRHLENFIPQIYGNVERRPGTKFVYNSANPVTFVPSQTQKVYPT